MTSNTIWPNNKKMAVILSFDVDAETAHVKEPHNINRPSVLSLGTYGRRTGLPRILRTLKEHDVPAEFFVPGAVAELDPSVIEKICDAGHPLGHHGYLHQRVDLMTPEDEEADLVKGLNALVKYSGYKPVGYRAPLWELHRRSPALLKKYGFLYDSSLQADDIPYTIDAGNNEKLLEIPGTWLLDDWEQFAFDGNWAMPFHIEETDKVFRLWKNEFDGLYEEGRCFTLTMHPQLIGRSSRIRMLSDLIAYMKQHDDVWFTTGTEIATLWNEGKLSFDHLPSPDLNLLFPNSTETI